MMVFVMVKIFFVFELFFVYIHELFFFALVCMYGCMDVCMYGIMGKLKGMLMCTCASLNQVGVLPSHNSFACWGWFSVQTISYLTWYKDVGVNVSQSERDKYKCAYRKSIFQLEPLLYENIFHRHIHE